MNGKRNSTYILFLSFSLSALLKAQDTVGLDKQAARLITISDHSVSNRSDNLPCDDPLFVRTMDLSKGDQEFNKKYPLWLPLADVVGINALINVIDRYILNYDFVRISLNSWGNNLRAGWPRGPGWVWH